MIVELGGTNGFQGVRRKDQSSLTEHKRGTIHN